MFTPLGPRTGPGSGVLVAPVQVHSDISVSDVLGPDRVSPGSGVCLLVVVTTDVSLFLQIVPDSGSEGTDE